jgi:tetratricopeptide (TPR) repeat protein
MRIGFRLSTLGQLTKEPDYPRQWLEHDRAALAITRALVAANRTNAIDRRNLADELMATANAQIENKDMAGALSGYNESLELFKALADADPTNSEAQRDLSFIYLRLAALSAQMGKAAAAREHYEHAVGITQQLLAQDPSDEEGLATAGSIYVALSKLAEDSGDLETAIENRKREIEVRGRMVAVDQNISAHWYVLAASYQPLALLYAKKGGALVGDHGIDMRVPKIINARQAAQWREARNAYEEALKIFEDLKAKGKLDAPYAAYPDAMRDYIAICDSFIARGPK